MDKKIKKQYQTRSAPDTETGQSGDTATGVSEMALIIFWVKQSDMA